MFINFSVLIIFTFNKRVHVNACGFSRVIISAKIKLLCNIFVLIWSRPDLTEQLTGFIIIIVIVMSFRAKTNFFLNSVLAVIIITVIMLFEALKKILLTFQKSFFWNEAILWHCEVWFVRKLIHRKRSYYLFTHNKKCKI